ncbi:bifunctional glyoxylate/hydroxypyruvate reductase B [Gilliamella sp. Pra-s65]|uniref:2-hydroxyacid dehydrogenase n=1 Tax=unclassified Gilliamella TaxID=2685620 RepID=UPI0013660474|nr:MULTISPECIES: D-glycerate dehydrogenase [unclassified Gilliamella]MWN90389.1 bifunctional glyoxylate/hydroxypyruvate reductase B [Gilliamella sp. Pra-s65]MWP73339.1 bifunctional glyoxylate/hydroxypyruvate reductase B [Gilliamella sp. Pra-s52]
MKKNVILFSNIPADQQARLEQAFNLTVLNNDTDFNSTTYTNALAKADGIIGNLPTRVDDNFLAKTPNLKAAATISVGFDNYDLHALKKRGIRLMNTPKVLTESTADLIFTLLMATARRTVELSNLIHNGKWEKGITPEYYGTDIYGKTIGILGMGRIGQAIAKRAYRGFDMNIVYYNRSAHTEIEQAYNAKRLALDNVLKQADFVVIILPLTEETTKLITKEKLALMKPSSILINGARGKIIDQQALFEALKNKTIKAAGLDVFEIEPLPTNSPLLQLDNVLLSPHVGSATVETRYAMAKCAVDNIITALKDEKPTENWVNPEVG